jgi:hypothetical protein
MWSMMGVYVLKRVTYINSKIVGVWLKRQYPVLKVYALKIDYRDGAQYLVPTQSCSFKSV